jgi:integrase
MGSLELPYLCCDRDRHGNVRYYFRRSGKKIRLRGEPASSEFMAAYSAARGGSTAQSEKSLKNSLDWLVDQYFHSADFMVQLGSTTRERRRRILLGICDEPISETNTKRIGTLPFSGIPKQKIVALRDRALPQIEAANDRLKTLRRMFSWAVEVEHLPINPAAKVKKLVSGSQGFHTWSIEEVRQYEAHHPIGSKSRLALALLLFTGQRRSDIVRLGPQHVKDGWLTFTQAKNAARKPVKIEIPLLAELQAIILATPTGHLSFLVTAFGKPHTAKGFGNSFRRWCDEAKLPEHCSAHGLRKAGACLAAENGATEKQLAAIFGWQTLEQPAHYTKAASRKRLAGDAMKMLTIREH